MRVAAGWSLENLCWQHLSTQPDHKLLQHANPQFVHLFFTMSSRQRDDVWAQLQSSDCWSPAPAAAQSSVCCLIKIQLNDLFVQMSPNSTLHFLRVLSNQPIKCEVDGFLRSLKYTKKILKDRQRFLSVWLHLLDLTKSCYFSTHYCSIVWKCVSSLSNAAGNLQLFYNIKKGLESHLKVFHTCSLVCFV